MAGAAAAVVAADAAAAGSAGAGAADAAPCSGAAAPAARPGAHAAGARPDHLSALIDPIIVAGFDRFDPGHVFSLCCRPRRV